MPPIRILLVDDFELWRRTVSSMLQKHNNWIVVVAEASDSLEAIQKAETLQPDLVLLDLGLPTLSGLEATKRIGKVAPRSKILVVSQESSYDLVQEVLNCGALGYVHKSCAHNDLLPAIEAVLVGKTFVSGVLSGSYRAGQTPRALPVKWALKGNGYEFCNCDFGCGCNFGGFPNSKDGSCRALVGMDVKSGTCGDVNLSGVKCAAVVAWPRAIHQGEGECVFVVDPAVSDKQTEMLAQIFTGKLGGMPWQLLGPTFAVRGLVKSKITIEGNGTKSTFRAEGVGEGRGDTFKNPVTGQDHVANIDLPDGLVWKKGQCGQGSFGVNAAGLSIRSEKTNWIFYNFDWSNG